MALGSSACGDTLVGSGYQGEPLMVLEGQVLLEESLPEPLGEVRVAMFWSSQGGHGEEQQQETVVRTSFPSRYSLTLYTPPPDEVLYQPPHSTGLVAVGLPLLYDDEDLSGGFDLGEEVLGGSQDVLVLFNLDSLGHGLPSGEDTDEPADGGAVEPLEPGYHAVQRLGESCDEDDLVLTEVDPADVTMAVGELWANLDDVDCDGDLDEWE